MRNNMDFLIKNCPTCHRLMALSPDSDVCKDCVEKQQNAIAEAETNEQYPHREDIETNTEDETGDETISVCRNCGDPSEIPGAYCLRCHMHIAKQARNATQALTDKLDRVPGIRGSGRSIIEGSRSHVLDIIDRSRRRKGSGSYTPSTKYSN